MTVSIGGDFGKPRPALVVQSDAFLETATATVLLLSGTEVNAPLLRGTVGPSEDNGLRKTSQVMIDKTMTVRREKLSLVFGQIDDKSLFAIDRALALFLGIAR